jgi:predicted acetyltransferase
VILRPLRREDESEALAAQRELAADGFEFLLDYQPGMPWIDFVQRHADYRAGRNLPDGFVPAAFLLAEEDGHVVGRCSIRHELNDFLREVGGHIGYGVRPQFRRRGYAKAILSEALEYCRQLGLERVLVTCDDENIGSRKTIESQGGQWESTIEHNGTLKRRYWIAL